MFTPPRPPVLILLAEDDPDDRHFAIQALKDSPLASTVRCVENGEELMDYLNRRGNYADPSTSPLPNLILLDLNMPRKDGRQAAKEIKENPVLRRIPVIALTTSQNEADVSYLYDLGINAFVTKPVTFDGFCDAINAIGYFWFEVVQLPPQE